MSTTVRDIMSTHVMAVRKNASFKEIAAMLREQRVSAFPVLDDDDKVIGVVSEADLMAKEVLRDAAPGMPGGILGDREQAKAKAEGVTAAELMTAPPVTIDPDASVPHAARLMYDRRVKRLPVIAEDGRLIGILTRSDVLRVFSRSDEEIRRELMEDVIAGTALTASARLTVTVKDGVVTITGAPETAAAGRDIIDAARHVEGVIAVRDQLASPLA
ncbi:MAG TPA: CBS domain-containing protein [Trebonia sp.]|nr:CBS domain-containing protein [Trebonia sp.]